MPSRRSTASAAVMNERLSDIDRSTVGTALSHFAAGLVPIAVALGRMLWRRPLDSLGLIVAAGAIVTIFVNALFLQASPHPAPMLASKGRPVAPTNAAGTQVPATHPAERDAGAAESLARSRARVVSDIQRELARRGLFDGPIDGVYGAKTDAAIRDFEQATGIKTNAQPDDALLRTIMRSPMQAPVTTAAVMPRPAPVNRTASSPAPAQKTASSSKRVLAVQRALADFGYGQVKPTGVFGPETKSAIEQFERERKLPVTGQVSDRLARELAVVTGRPLD